MQAISTVMQAIWLPDMGNKHTAAVLVSSSVRHCLRDLIVTS